MKVKRTDPGEAGMLAPVASPRTSPDAATLGWRLRLEALWERKLDEVLALAAASQGESVAGDDGREDGLRSRRLHHRAARAYEDLAEIVDAIARISDGTYGRCARCHRRMSDKWLADEPQIRYCAKCHGRLRR
jgi:RNA polymerase-binding transcription factor DksA